MRRSESAAGPGPADLAPSAVVVAVLARRDHMEPEGLEASAEEVEAGFAARDLHQTHLVVLEGHRVGDAAAAASRGLRYLGCLANHWGHESCEEEGRLADADEVEDLVETDATGPAPYAVVLSRDACGPLPL